MKTVRIYPACCTSAYCGKGSSECPECPNYQTLKAFENWVSEHNAKPADRIWSPNVYIAEAELSDETNKTAACGLI